MNNLPVENQQETANPPGLTRGVGSKSGVLLRGVYSKVQPSIDWITATSQDDNLAAQWYQIFRSYRQQQDAQYQIGDWNQFGYQGLKIGNMIWAYHPKQGALFTVMSHSADVYWQDIVGEHSRITRMDLAVTVEYARPLRNIAAKHFNMLQRHGLTTPQKRYMQDAEGGQTLYVGSVHSEQMGRLYDKGVQSKLCPPGLCWRYEVMYRKPRSSVIANELSLMARQPGSDLHRSVAATVHNWFLSRAVKPHFYADGEVSKAEVSYTETSVDRKLKWLQTQVKPSIAWLIMKGHHAEVYDALGLEDLTMP